MIRLQEEFEKEDSGPSGSFKHLLGVAVSHYTIILPLIVQCEELLNVLDNSLGYTACIPVLWKVFSLTSLLH